MDNPFETISSRLANIESLLLDLHFPQSEPIEASDRLNIDDACQLLNRTRSWVFKRTMLKEIPYSKFRGRLVFSRKDLQAWIDQQTIPVLNPSDTMSERLAKTAKRRDK
jgi:hypothetical protein